MMTPTQIWNELDPKLIAILRGIQPHETKDIVCVLLALGFKAIEVPLNSPSALTSIETAVECASSYGPSLIGAGTVLQISEVQQVANTGANLIVSPNTDEAVVKKTIELGMASFPGVFTPSEAHQAVQLGATGLKFFPASVLGPEGIKAIRATLAKSVSLAAVGGVGSSNFRAYRENDIHAFGLGSNLYKPGDGVKEVKTKAQVVLDAYHQAA